MVTVVIADLMAALEEVSAGGGSYGAVAVVPPPAAVSLLTRVVPMSAVEVEKKMMTLSSSTFLFLY